MYQLEGYLRNKVNLPARSVVITFDDGLKSVNRYAYPILKQYGFHATAFIISSRIKRHPQKWAPKSLQFMSISELKQIQDVLTCSRIPIFSIGLIPIVIQFCSAAAITIFCLILSIRGGRWRSLIRTYSISLPVWRL